MRRLLWAAGGTALAGIAACIYAVVFLGPAEEAVQPPPPAVQATAMSRTSLAPLADYAVIWQKNFRPPPPTPAITAQAPPGATAPPSPQLQNIKNITLVGTASDLKAPFGLFREAGGQVKCITVGQTIGGATVVAISDGAATLKFGGETFKLTVVKGQGSKP
ncbi:MAG: hypothetical protein NT049_01890 [Planctomycetota bacterium]|nr:hypothetical protein [Planctomycetota bacterium]